MFDTCRSAWPDTSPGDLLDEHGRGIGIVGMVADAWGAHLSRSRMSAGGVAGKAVWCVFALPGPWPYSGTAAPPVLVARHLAATLASCGITNTAHRHGKDVSLVSVPLRTREEVNVWIEPRHLTFVDTCGARVRRPVVDLQDVAESLVRRYEEARGCG